MSKYSSICTAINVIESIDKMMNDHGKGSSRTEEVIHDLQSIAQDVRYGGKWDGDFTTVAEALTCCTETGTNCQICPYRREGKACIPNLKKDAAMAIRQLWKDAQDAKAELAEARKPAQWQREDMENGNTPPEVFPWEDDAEAIQMAPAAEVMGGEIW